MELTLEMLSYVSLAARCILVVDLDWNARLPLVRKFVFAKAREGCEVKRQASSTVSKQRQTRNLTEFSEVAARFFRKNQATVFRQSQFIPLHEVINRLLNFLARKAEEGCDLRHGHWSKVDKSENEFPNERQPFFSDVREIDVEALRWQQEVNLVINRRVFQCRHLSVSSSQT